MRMIHFPRIFFSNIRVIPIYPENPCRALAEADPYASLATPHRFYPVYASKNIKYIPYKCFMSAFSIFHNGDIHNTVLGASEKLNNRLSPLWIHIYIPTIRMVGHLRRRLTADKRDLRDALTLINEAIRPLPINIPMFSEIVWLQRRRFQSDSNYFEVYR